jgi:hypothetical protein
MEIKEEWRAVIGWEGLYEVSNIGNVRRLPHRGRAIKVLKPFKEPKRYVRVVLFVNNSAKTCHVHRLVAKSFIPNPENKPNVNHKDGNKHNNLVSNLEWCTQSENAIHSYRIGLQKPVRSCKLTDKQMAEIREMYKTGKYFKQTIADMFSVSRVTIYKILSNKI